MMLVNSMLLIIAAHASITSARPTFTGDFLLSNLIIASSFQTQPNSTANSSVSFVFCDQDKPEAAAIHCSVEWAVGLLPPTSALANLCDNNSVGVWFPEGTYHGINNFTIALSHTYVDDSVGQYPYNRLTKFGEVNMTFPGTPNYECDAVKARCTSCDGTTIIAPVTRAIA